MFRYIVRRILWGIAMLFIVSAVVFLIFYILPSADPAVLRAGRNAGPRRSPQIRHSLGLDKPVWQQYLDYMRQVFLHFNFGYSYQYNVPGPSADLHPPAGDDLAGHRRGDHLARRRAHVGIVSAIRRRSILDRTTMTGSLALISAPVFWLGLVSLYLFADDIGVWKIFPGQGAFASREQSSPEGGGDDPAVAGPRGRHLGDLRAVHAGEHDRHDVRGLHPHRAGQGTARAHGDQASRRAQRDHPDRHSDRSRRGHAARRQRDPHRNGVQHPRSRAATL